MNSTTPIPGAPIPTQRAFSRPAAMIGGAAGLVALTAIATTFALRAPSAPQASAGSATPMVAQSPATLVSPTSAAAPAEGSAVSAKPAPQGGHERGSAAAPTAPSTTAHAQHGTVDVARTQHAANVCATCGKVESVSAIEKKGDGTGLGVVGGAVVGGLVGSQLGGGSGKSAMTVLGALGGGFAGNEVEKRARATTAYQVHVRMDDGTLRTLTQSTAPAVGQKVTVEGSRLKARA